MVMRGARNVSPLHTSHFSRRTILRHPSSFTPHSDGEEVAAARSEPQGAGNQGTAAGPAGDAEWPKAGGHDMHKRCVGGWGAAVWLQWCFKTVVTAVQ